MSRRNLNHKMIDNLSIAVNQTSSITIVDGIDEAIIIVTWTGSSPVGVITIEASNSKADEFTKGTEVYEVLDFASAINVSGNSGSHQINFTALPFRAMRFVYTASSGTGNLTAHVNGASIGN